MPPELLLLSPLDSPLEELEAVLVASDSPVEGSPEEPLEVLESSPVVDIATVVDAGVVLAELGPALVVDPLSSLSPSVVFAGSCGLVHPPTNITTSTVLCITAHIPR